MELHPRKSPRIAHERRAVGTRLIGVLCLAVVCLLAGCIHRGPREAIFERPRVGPGGTDLLEPAANEPFSERTLLETRTETPPQTLARIDGIFQEIRSVSYPAPSWRQLVVDQEIESIRREIDRLGIGTKELFHLRLGGLRPEEKAKFRKAAGLYLRWGIGLMRSGETNQRVWGAEKLRTALELDPGSPIITLVLDGYLQYAGFWSNEQDLLDTYRKDHGHDDAIELRRMRGRERAWKVYRTREDLNGALAMARDFVRERGGDEGAPSWLDLEYARLLYLADSTSASRRWAERALPRTTAVAFDSSSAAQAELLLGILDVREIDYDGAWEHLGHAHELASATKELAQLASWMTVPWDLWTPKQQVEFLRAADQQTRVDQFWEQSDPIWATPDLAESKVEYLRRVGEAWFALSGVDPGMPGPLTDAGRVILRFGWPMLWTSSNDAPPPVSARAPTSIAGAGLGFGIQRIWKFLYRFPSGKGDRAATVIFGDRGSTCRFTAMDSLKGPAWPPFVYTRDFGGKGYRLNTSLSRFREPKGKIRLVLSYDTYLPEYAVRYPLQGLRYEGEARVRSALYYADGIRWRAGPKANLVLDRETEIAREWTFRRRAGSVVLPGLNPGTVRLASELRLRDRSGRTVAIAVDNGVPGKLQGFSESGLDASDLLFISSLEGVPLEQEEHEVEPGWLAYGPDLSAGAIQPRAGRVFLAGEELAFYLEVYNLDIRTGVTDAELLTSLERLNPDSTAEYTVSIRGQGQTLIKYGVRQWNIVRGIGLSNLTPGRYRLRADIVDRRSSRRLQRVSEFRVVDPAELIQLYHWDELEAPLGS